jgi:hypothetical protein
LPVALPEASRQLVEVDPRDEQQRAAVEHRPRGVVGQRRGAAEPRASARPVGRDDPRADARAVEQLLGRQPAAAEHRAELFHCTSRLGSMMPGVPGPGAC